ncbi:phosphatidylserine decarboxylase [Candidatus Woesearchaeota archaeon]|nr:phosphatidylserine decarboxylase [Candidatus Woesearchaeota archaeon]
MNVAKALFKYTLKDKKVNPPFGDNIVSPATGKVLKIIKISDKKKIKIRKGLLGLVETTTKGIIKEGYLISIFLRLYDNHINRAPVNGKVVSVSHSNGKFRNAHSLKALRNEKTEIVFDSDIGRIKMLQIAGYVARRIETFIMPGQIVEKGQSIGLIKLGSQVTIVLPASIKLKIKKGQKVKAGLTVIGEF